MPRGEGDRSARPARRRRRGARTGPGESRLTVWGAPSPGTAGLPGAEAGSPLLLGPAPVPKHVTVLSAGPPWSHTDAVAGRRQPPSGKGTEHEQLWPLVLHPLLSRGSGRAPQASGEGSSRAFLVPQRVFLTEVRGGPPPTWAAASPLSPGPAQVAGVGGGTPRRGPRRGWGGLRACTWGCGGSRQVQRLQRSAGHPRRPQRGCPLRLAARQVPVHGHSLCPGPAHRHCHPHFTAQDSKTHRVRVACARPRGSLEAGSFQMPADGCPSQSWDRRLLSRQEVRAAPGTWGAEWLTVDTARGGRWAGHGDWELVHRPPTATALLCDDPAPGSQTTLTPGQAELCWARFPADGQGPLALDVSSSRDTELSGEAGSRLAQAPAQSMCAVPLPV